MIKNMSFLFDIGNYDERVVARSVANDKTEVSTAYTSDEGYETALINNGTVVPVERYKNKKLAAIGHRKWVKFAKKSKGKKVIKLGWSGLRMEKVVTLR